MRSARRWRPSLPPSRAWHACQRAPHERQRKALGFKRFGDALVQLCRRSATRAVLAIDPRRCLRNAAPALSQQGRAASSATARRLRSGRDSIAASYRMAHLIAVAGLKNST